MALTVAVSEHGIANNKRSNRGTLAFDSSYPTGGESLTASNVGLSRIEEMLLQPKSGYSFEFDHDNDKVIVYSATALPSTVGTINDNNNAATQGGAVYAVPKTMAANVSDEFVADGTKVVEIVDNAGGSSGVDVYVVVDDLSFHPSYTLGHLEFVSPTNADGSGTIASGAATYHVRDDDDAATNGTIVRAVAADAGLETTAAAAKDIVVPLSDGSFIHINHATTGSTPDLVFDEDAGNSYERLLAETVDSGAETSPTYSRNTTDEGAAQAIFMVKDDEYILVHADSGPLTFAVGSGGPTCVVEGRPDAASLAGAVVVGAKAAGAGLDAALPSGRTGFVSLSNGEYIEIAYAASPAGVALYANPAAASTDLTLECVVVDNLDETFTVATSRSQRRSAAKAASEIASTTDLSGLTGVRFQAIGV